MLLGERLELRPFGRRSVLVEYFANDAGGIQASQPRDVDRAFRVAHALEHATVARAKRKNVASTPQVRWYRRRVYRDLDRRRAVACADARRHPESR